MKELPPLPRPDTPCTCTVQHAGTLTIEGTYLGKSDRVEVRQQYGEGFRTWRFLHSDITSIEEIP